MYAVKMPANTAHTRYEQTLTSHNILNIPSFMLLDVQS